MVLLHHNDLIMHSFPAACLVVDIIQMLLFDVQQIYIPVMSYYFFELLMMLRLVVSNNAVIFFPKSSWNTPHSSP